MIPALTARNTGSDLPEWWLSHAGHPAPERRNIQVLGLLSTVVALLGVAVMITYSLQNGIILLVMAFLISPYGLPMAAIWLLGKAQDLKFTIRDLVYR